MRSCLLACVLLLVAVTAAFPAVTSESFVGDWEGNLDAYHLRVVWHLVHAGDKWTATMDSPDQGGYGIPADEVKVKGLKLYLALDAVNMEFEGTLSKDGNSIEGMFTQGERIPLTLTRANATPKAPVPSTPVASAPNRPQEPKPPFPYRSEDVTVPGPGGISLAGTLTTPNGNGPFPVVVFATGSGPSDRDESIEGHKPFLVLSDYLTRQGIAVLRLDDRGTGKSTGNWAAATTEDFAQDALAEVAYLKTRPEIDSGKIGLAGHSEGGMIAPIAASRSADVALVVMLAGPAVPAGQLLSRQITDIVRANGAVEPVAQAFGGAVRRMSQIAASTSDTALMQKQIDAVVDSLTAQMTAIDPAAAQMVSQQAHGLGGFIMSPQFRYWLTLKPEETLRKVKQPVLAINGSLDLNVSAKENLPVIEKALHDGGNKDVTVVVLPGLNHLFQTATTGSPMEYDTIEETMSPVAMKTVSDWILARTSAKKK